MQLQRFINVICASYVEEKTSYPSYNNSLRSVSDECTLTVTFEYPFLQRKCKIKETGQNIKSSTKTKQAPSQNPIHKLLVECKKDKQIIDKIKQGKTTHITHKQYTPLLTQASWNIYAVAPIILWLQQNNKRYIHSDWVNVFQNGERECIVNQRGMILTNRQYTHQRHYMCTGGFHGIVMHFCHKSMSTTNTNPDWWKCKYKQNGFQNGVLCTSYQQRTYAWNNHALIHLTSTDGKQFRVTVEYILNETSEENMHDLQILISQLSYHLSQHVQQQKRI